MTPVDPRAGPRQSEAPQSFPHPSIVCSAHHSHARSCEGGGSREKAMHCWVRLDWKHDWTPLTPLYDNLRCWQGDEEICSVQRHPRQTSYVSSLAYWTAPHKSFFALSLPSVYGDQFWILPGEVLMLTANTLQPGSSVWEQYLNLVSHIPNMVSENKNKDSGFLGCSLSLARGNDFIFVLAQCILLACPKPSCYSQYSSQE